MFSNAKQHIPPLFQAIMKNHEKQEALGRLFISGSGTPDDWKHYVSLIKEMGSLRTDAAKALQRSPDINNGVK